MRSVKEGVHPNSYLLRVKNVRKGLSARTKILDFLDKRVGNAATIGTNTALSYRSVIHHLRLLEAEETVMRKGKKPYLWKLTGLGQERLPI
ncbi:hypothetical protein KAI12_05130 [Candidatus Bathyarchaeota archaeon]|nr:hypothetical protein [Candidatus Bathyarchaeota archaeon]